MSFGPVLLQSGELAGQLAAHMGGHALALVKELHGVLRFAHLQLAMDELIGHAVKVVVGHHVIIDVHLGLVARFERPRRQDYGAIMLGPLIVEFAKPAILVALRVGLVGFLPSWFCSPKTNDGTAAASLHSDCAIPTHFGHRSDGAEKLSE
jgi:hypothetical protein